MTDQPDARPAPTADLEEWLADEHAEPPEGGGFRIDSDELATWAFRKRRAHQTELDRLRALAAAERDKIDAWERDVTAGPANRVAFFDGALAAYYEMLRAERGDDLPATYKVPGGAIARRKNPDRLEVVDEEEAIGWLLANRTELVRMAVDKAKVKKLLQAPDLEDAEGGAELDLVDPDTGEMVPGVAHVVGEYRIDVKPEAAS